MIKRSVLKIAFDQIKAKTSQTIENSLECLMMRFIGVLAIQRARISTPPAIQRSFKHLSQLIRCFPDLFNINMHIQQKFPLSLYMNV